MGDSYFILNGGEPFFPIFKDGLFSHLPDGIGRLACPLSVLDDPTVSVP